MKEKFSNQELMLLNQGTIVQTPEGNTYLHLSYWFKRTEDRHILEVFGLDELPEDLKKYIEDTIEL